MLKARPLLASSADPSISAAKLHGANPRKPRASRYLHKTKAAREAMACTLAARKKEDERMVMEVRHAAQLSKACASQSSALSFGLADLSLCDRLSALLRLFYFPGGQMGGRASRRRLPRPPEATAAGRRGRGGGGGAHAGE